MACNHRLDRRRVFADLYLTCSGLPPKGNQVPYEEMRFFSAVLAVTGLRAFQQPPSKSANPWASYQSVFAICWCLASSSCWISFVVSTEFHAFFYRVVRAVCSAGVNGRDYSPSIKTVSQIVEPCVC